MTGPAPLYRAAAQGVMRIEPLDGGLTAVFHRCSGLTHLLVEPAPQILAMLADGDLTAAALMARLSEAFYLAAVDPDALTARLGEMVAAGLVEERGA